MLNHKWVLFLLKGLLIFLLYWHPLVEELCRYLKTTHLNLTSAQQYREDRGKLSTTHSNDSPITSQSTDTAHGPVLLWYLKLLHNLSKCHVSVPIQSVPFPQSLLFSPGLCPLPPQGLHNLVSPRFCTTIASSGRIVFDRWWGDLKVFKDVL